MQSTRQAHAWRRWLRALGLLAAGAWWQAAAAAPQAIATIVDGDAVLIRGAQRHALVEGMRLQGDDIVRTGDGARLARLEFADGSVLDLGGASQLMVMARGPRLAYLAQGWAKLASAAPQALGSPCLSLLALEGTAVLRVAERQAVAYLERGRVQWQDRRADGVTAPQPLREGHAAVRLGDAVAAIAPRPPADWLQALPRAFADSLPSRARLYQARVVEPGAPARPAYDELAAWLHAEPALRQGMVARFTPLAQDKAFRAALVAELRRHPEWDRVLHPEKYRPKPRPVLARANAPAAPAAAARPQPAADVALAPAPYLPVSETP